MTKSQKNTYLLVVACLFPLISIVYFPAIKSYFSDSPLVKDGKESAGGKRERSSLANSTLRNPGNQREPATATESLLNDIKIRYREGGFDGVIPLLDSIESDQKKYFATKFLAALASQSEPQKVYGYLLERDPYLLTDSDILRCLMSSPKFTLEENLDYVSRLPVGGSRLIAHGNLAQLFVRPENIDNLSSNLQSIADPEVRHIYDGMISLALFDNYDPVKASQILATTGIRAGEFLTQIGEGFATRDDFSLAGLKRLDEMDLGSYKTSIRHGYVTAMLQAGHEPSSAVVAYEASRFLLGQDQGEGLNAAASKALPTNPRKAVETMQQSGVDEHTINLLITRNFNNIAANDRQFVSDYIESQTDTLVRDSLLTQYLLSLSNSQLTFDEFVKGYGSIRDPGLREFFTSHQLAEFVYTDLPKVRNFIMQQSSGEERDSYLFAVLPRIYSKDQEMGLDLLGQLDGELFPQTYQAMMEVANSLGGDHEKKLVEVAEKRNPKK